MFDNLVHKKLMLILPVAAAVVFAGCTQDKANVPAPEAVDLTETEDMFDTPVQPNPLNVPDPETVVVSVNGEEITHGDIMNVVGPMLQRYAAQVPPQQLQQLRTRLYAQAKEQLVGQKLIEAAIADAGISVDAAEVDEVLDEEKARLPEDTTLEDLLEAQGVDIETVKEDIKKQLAMKKFFEMKTDDVEPATEAEALEFYNSNTNRFVQPETVTASHILITVNDEDSDEVKAEKKAQLASIREDILAGNITFEEAAKANSDCPSSENGGALGQPFTMQSPMAPEFKAASFAQEVDEVGEIVETQFGYHVIKVTDHTEQETASFEDEKERIVEFLTNQKKQEAIAGFMEDLRKNADIQEM